ncbi:MAG: HDIG domain-containing metalloprotein [Chloroflexota bacterium]
MFIPRTLSQGDRRIPGGAVVRAVGIGLLLTLALTLILAATIGPGQVNLRAGQVAPETINAPSSITFVSEVQTEAQRDAAAAAEEDVFVPIPGVRMDQVNAFDTVASRIRRALELRDNGIYNAEELPAAISSRASTLSDAQVAVAATLTLEQWDALAAVGRAALDDTLADDVIDEDLAAARQRLRESISADIAQPQRELMGDLAALHVEPTFEFSADRTAQARERARAEVPDLVVRLQQDQNIISANEVITAADIEVLQRLGLTQGQGGASTFVGYLLASAVISALLVAFLWRAQPEIWFRNRSLLLFLLVLLVSALALRIAGDRTLWAYAVPIPAAVMLTAILLGTPIGAAMTIALATVAGIVNREALEVTLYVLAGGIVALLAMVHAERLNVFYRAGALLAVTNLAVVGAFALLQPSDLAAVAQLAIAAVVNAVLSVLLAVGSFAVLGNLFGIMTIFQLLELANPSNRMLRRLLLETPGTYHHSVMVGNLAERAAETIGADPLLARVAAYYHDIGKTKNPLAFIENQGGGRNIHDDLSAETSARIIASHVRDGIDLAYEHGLPVQVIGFIPQHHGTSVMSYFHQKALREASGNAELVDESRFRYPGPKPQTREAAILMLADGVEASVRSLDSKDESSIRTMVDRIVDARVEDGQLDDAELTLRNIAQIKDAFVGQLLGMYHQRIKYPDNVVPLDRREQA